MPTARYVLAACSLMLKVFMALAVAAATTPAVTSRSPRGGANQEREKQVSAVRVEQGYVATDDGTRLFYQKAGNGRQVIIVPGRLFLFDDFKQLARGRTLIFYDMRGRGRSDMIADDQKAAKVGIHHDVKDLERIRRHFGASKVSLIGYSYLGLMVVMYAMEHPERVERIVQLGPVPLKFGTRYPDNLVNRDRLAEIGADPAEVAKVERLLAEGYEKTNPKDYCEKEWAVTRFRLVGNPANVDRLGKSQCDMPNEWPVNLRKHFQHSFVSVQRLDIPKEQVSKVSVPVLTIHGTKDRNAPYGAGREWASLLPDARLLTVAGAAHASWVDAPQLVFQSIDVFLKGGWPDAAEKVTP